MTDEKKKAAFFADWEGVSLKDSTGFQSGWYKGFEAGRKYENERIMEIADALLELKRSGAKRPVRGKGNCRRVNDSV